MYLETLRISVTSCTNECFHRILTEITITKLVPFFYLPSLFITVSFWKFQVKGKREIEWCFIFQEHSWYKDINFLAQDNALGVSEKRVALIASAATNKKSLIRETLYSREEGRRWIYVSSASRKLIHTEPLPDAYSDKERTLIRDHKEWRGRGGKKGHRRDRGPIQYKNSERCI